MSIVEYENDKVGLAVGQDPDGNVYVAPLALELHSRSTISGDPGALTIRNIPGVTDKRVTPVELAPVATEAPVDPAAGGTTVEGAFVVPEPGTEGAPPVTPPDTPTT